MPFFGSPLLGMEGSGFFTMTGGAAPSPPLPPVLHPPVVTPPAAQIWRIGTAITPVQVSATNAPTSWALSGAPSGISISSTGQITGTPAVGTTLGPHTVGITATNAGGTSPSVNMSITINPPIPVVTAPPAQTWVIGTPITMIQVSATNSPTSWALSNAPTGITINSMGEITGTPAAGTTTGLRQIGITATNPGGTSASVNMATTITAAVQAPVISSALAVSGQEGTSFSYTITATGTTPITFGATGLPAGLTFASPTISGTLPAHPAGPFSIALTATNTAGTDNKTLVLTVTEATAGWTMSYLFGPGGIPTNFTMSSNGSIPFANWTGYNATDAADVSDALYDLTSMAAMPVNLWAKYSVDPVFKLVTFDNFGGTPAGNSITNWGWNSVTNSIYISGSNSTSQPIQLELRKT